MHTVKIVTYVALVSSVFIYGVNYANYMCVSWTSPKQSKIKLSQFIICFKYAVGYTRTFLKDLRINLDLKCRVTADRRVITAVVLYHELGSTCFKFSAWQLLVNFLITIFLRSVLEVTTFRSHTHIGSSKYATLCTPAVGWCGTKHYTLKVLFYILLCMDSTTLHSFFVSHNYM
jgi:hypothetical protein